MNPVNAEPQDPEQGQRAALRALAHPLRLRILRAAAAEPVSAAALARSLEVSQALASHHVRRLVDAGLLRLVETRPHRGGRERFYESTLGRHISLPGDKNANDELEALARVYLANAQSALTRRTPGTSALFAGDERQMTSTQWEQLRSRVIDALADAEEGPDDAAIRVSITVALFEVDEQ